MTGLIYYKNTTKIIIRQTLICKLLVSDLVITILGLSSAVVSLPTTSIPSIVIGCLRLFLKLSILGLTDTCTRILRGSQIHDGIKSQ